MANGCGDENIRFVVTVVTGRFVVVVVVVENDDVDVFIVVDLWSDIDGSDVVEMSGGDVNFDVIFGV